ncbi:uncharacterized protein RAG0_03209 [Rhynchosporium agropyri]|uniref:SnoaL-like domain-containing protein n=2 Tax=Rhynchosporium TaxID=38037 RepID=A0A1E1K457_9HELO|nr:uncharacterized protein RAG0_03209 [Rhynchosporium agropyri]CZS96652.1 uncharacterized protein RCO7_04789 [Rhynchosporium commune]
MKTSSYAGALLALMGAAQAVDMSPYKAGPNVEAGFATFVKEWYRTSEDKASTTSYTDFWVPVTGELILAGNKFVGYHDMLAVKQKLLPPGGNKAWWHLIKDSKITGETATNKTYVADIIIQTTYTPGNCSQVYGAAAFTILKNHAGVPILTPHSQAVSLYNLTVSDVRSPTDVPCTRS